MAAGVDQHIAMAKGLAFIISEIALVQPLFGDDDLIEDVEEYVELDGSELPIIDDALGVMAVQEGDCAYIDISVQGKMVRVSCQII